MLAQQKQELIKEEFKEWIFKDLHRREDLCKIYNERLTASVHGNMMEAIFSLLA